MEHTLANIEMSDTADDYLDKLPENDLIVHWANCVFQNLLIIHTHIYLEIQGIELMEIILFSTYLWIIDQLACM